MYEKFYGLKEPPFNLTPDSRFLYMSQHHREAMAAVLYGVRERKCFTLLTGEIGSGKTTLCRAVMNELGAAAAHVVLILDSFLNETELLEAVCDQLHIELTAHTRRGLTDSLHRYLEEQHRLDRLVVALIDEAQNLSDGTLEQIRLLGNLETERAKLLQIVLVGQPELRSTLQDPKLEQLDQRIAVRCHLRPLEPEEVEPYIYHRLRVAGISAMIDFPQRSVRMIYEFTGGVPRKINLLCDRALLAGYVASTRVIDEAIVRTAAMEVAG
ncbi:Flp pilus assembly complex ATPase component TadA, partial [Candidatus Sumerlaeota bacterium]|nr:Flp pilus assembly complex ATPase component TadA [Candidatus Sumerlaeota bacterium]